MIYARTAHAFNLRDIMHRKTLQERAIEYVHAVTRSMVHERASGKVIVKDELAAKSAFAYFDELHCKRQIYSVYRGKSYRIGKRRGGRPTQLNIDTVAKIRNSDIFAQA